MSAVAATRPTTADGINVYVYSFLPTVHSTLSRSTAPDTSRTEPIFLESWDFHSRLGSLQIVFYLANFAWTIIYIFLSDAIIRLRLINPPVNFTVDRVC